MTLTYLRFTAVFLYMAVNFWVASITVCMCFRVSPRECRSFYYSNERTLNFLLNVERVETKSNRCWWKFTGLMLWRKQQFTSGETVCWRKRKCHRRRDFRTASNKQNWRKLCKCLSNFAWKWSADCQEQSRAIEYRKRNS